MKRNFNWLLVLTLLLIVSCVSTGGSKEPIVIKLMAEDAMINTSGSMVLEEGGDGYNIGYWETTDDEVSWDIEIPVADEYTIMMKFSCDPQFPGSILNLTVDGQTFEAEIFDTGTWTDYYPIEFGTLKLSAGTHKVLVKAIHVENRFVCNLRDVRFSNKAAMNK